MIRNESVKVKHLVSNGSFSSISSIFEHFWCATLLDRLGYLNLSFPSQPIQMVGSRVGELLNHQNWSVLQFLRPRLQSWTLHEFTRASSETDSAHQGQFEVQPWIYHLAVYHVFIRYFGHLGMRTDENCWHGILTDTVIQSFLDCCWRRGFRGALHTRTSSYSVFC